ncbi:MAG: hypothetical protein GMKNLPBB_00999 [Myxococcota bacterium]|nr:hypothetical protein [Myxococcota bacterium]
MKNQWLLLVGFLITTAACGGGGGADTASSNADGASPAVDASAVPDAAAAPDGGAGIPQFPVDSGPASGCDRAAALKAAWPLTDKISSGEVTTREEGGFRITTVDASAGGMEGARNNPFTYLNFSTGAKAAITDFQSLADNGWDIAFRRTAIRVNGGDSGPGRRKLAVTEGGRLDKAPAVPAPDEFADDNSLDDQCRPFLDPLGAPVTAVNRLKQNSSPQTASWYDYSGQHGVSPIPGDIYFLHNGLTGEVTVFEITGWKSGVFSLRWKKAD